MNLFFSKSLLGERVDKLYLTQNACLLNGFLVNVGEARYFVIFSAEWKYSKKKRNTPLNY